MMFLQKNNGDRSDTWITPPWIIEKIGRSTLDPCGYRDGAIVDTADHYFSLDQGQDGLKEEWFGSVYVNPPYTETDKWLKKGIKYFNESGNSVIFCLPCRTCTKWYQENVKQATGILFFDKKIHFLDANGYDRGGASFPVCLVAYGLPGWERVRRIAGMAVLLDHSNVD
jgi:hypothetical protein